MLNHSQNCSGLFSLPRDCSTLPFWFWNGALDEAARREMTVLLYDEGMYPSGSATG